jgi:hypothetical protein
MLQALLARARLCTIEELAETHKLMIINQKQEELVEDFEMILPNAREAVSVSLGREKDTHLIKQFTISSA